MCAIRPIVGAVGLGARRIERRHDVAVVVEERIGDPRLVQLGDQQPAEVELTRRAGRAGALVVGLCVDPHVALEAIQEVGASDSARADV